MKNFSKTTKIIFSIAILISITLTFTQVVQAQDDTLKPIYFTPQVGIGDEVKVGEEIKVDERTFAKYIVAIYNWSIRAIVLLAIVMIMIAGSRWMWAGGNAAAITQAKNQITSALIGLVIAIGSYTLLNFINPSLVRLGSLEIKPVEKTKITGGVGDFLYCSYYKTKSECESNEWVACIWENNICVTDPTTEKCGLSVGEIASPDPGATAECCGRLQDNRYVEWKYAYIPPQYNCKNVCGDDWVTIDESQCQSKIGNASCSGGNLAIYSPNKGSFCDYGETCGNETGSIIKGIVPSNIRESDIQKITIFLAADDNGDDCFGEDTTGTFELKASNSWFAVAEDGGSGHNSFDCQVESGAAAIKARACFSGVDCSKLNTNYSPSANDILESINFLLMDASVGTATLRYKDVRIYTYQECSS